MKRTIRLLAGVSLAMSSGLAQAQVVTMEELETLLERDQPGATAEERAQAPQSVVPQSGTPQVGAAETPQDGIATTELPPAAPGVAVPAPAPDSGEVPAPQTGTVAAPAPLPPADGGGVIPPAPTETAAAAPAPDRTLTAAEIDAATYTGGPMPKGRSPVTVKMQVLLDRAGISPGVIDGIKGGMSRTALTAFQSVVGLPATGEMDMEAWQILGGDRVGPITTVHTISADEIASLSPGPLPTDYAELAQLDHIGYTSMPELLGELYHMDENFLRSLNPGASWTAGEQITVVEPVVPGERVLDTLAHIVVDKARGRLVALDHDGAVIGDYPVTIGSSGTPSPTGTHKVVAVAMNPTYHYSPDNFVQGENMQPLTLPPGPNGPVGSVWIDLDAPSYGLHGTPRPEKLFVTASHGCVRLTNWDAQELAAMVNARMAVEPGAQIDVTFSDG
jgi:lipoprotein-anchoring transpeptidase ErfK/SrfK